MPALAHISPSFLSNLTLFFSGARWSLVLRCIPMSGAIIAIRVGLSYVSISFKVEAGVVSSFLGASIFVLAIVLGGVMQDYSAWRAAGGCSQLLLLCACLLRRCSSPPFPLKPNASVRRGVREDPRRD